MAIIAGGFRWPWEGAETPQEAVKKTVESSIASTAVTPGVGAVTSTTGRILTLLGGTAVGAIAASILGGGGKQEQDQTTTVPQDTNQETQQTTDQATEAEFQPTTEQGSTTTTSNTTKTYSNQRTYYNFKAGRDISYSGSTTLTPATSTTATSTTDISAELDQITASIADLKSGLEALQTADVQPEQTASQTTDNTMLLVILGAAAVLGYMWLKRK